MKDKEAKAGYYRRTGTGKKTEKSPSEPFNSPLVDKSANKLPSKNANFPEGLNTGG